jgi:hypothetical protein
MIEACDHLFQPVIKKFGLIAKADNDLIESAVEQICLIGDTRREPIELFLGVPQRPSGGVQVANRLL